METIPNGLLELVDALKPLLKSLPNTKGESPTFFGIAGFPKWENVMSNVLAWLMNPNSEHELGTLFLATLIEFLPEKDQEWIRYAVEEGNLGMRSRII